MHLALNGLSEGFIFTFVVRIKKMILGRILAGSDSRFGLFGVKSHTKIIALNTGPYVFMPRAKRLRMSLHMYQNYIKEIHKTKLNTLFYLKKIHIYRN